MTRQNVLGILSRYDGLEILGKRAHQFDPRVAAVPPAEVGAGILTSWIDEVFQHGTDQQLWSRMKSAAESHCITEIRRTGHEGSWSGIRDHLIGIGQSRQWSSETDQAMDAMSAEALANLETFLESEATNREVSGRYVATAVHGSYDLREAVSSSEGPRPATVDDTPEPVRWALIQDAARRDRNQGARSAVQRAEERFRRGYLGPTAWFFSDGAWNFVALIDGKLVGASRDHAAEFPAEDPITFKTTKSGSVRSVTIGPAMMLDPRPRSEVERLLDLAGANSADEFRELLPFETAFDSRLDIAPSRGSAEAGVSGGVGSVRDALAQLEELKSAALITEQEYAAKRAEILGRL